MDPIRGAGHDFRKQVHAGDVFYVAQDHAFRNQNTNQDYSFTTDNRIVRLDRRNGQYLAYNETTREFEPTHLHANETIRETQDEQELFRLLVAKQGWGDFFAGKASDFAGAAAKQAIFGVTAGLTAAVVGPVVVKAANGAFDAIAKPVHHVAVQAKAQAAHVAQVAHVPHIPHPHLPHIHIPGIPPDPFIDPNMPVPRPWWHRTMFGAGGTGIGAIAGTFVAGPIGTVVGGSVGAGIGALFS